MKITTFPSILSDLGTAKERDVDWAEVGRLLALRHDPTYTEKKDLPIFLPGAYAEQRTNNKRNDENVASVHLGVLDFDSVYGKDVEELQARLAGLAYLIYSTWSNKAHLQAEDKLKIRLVVPFNRPVLPSEWRAVWGALWSLFGELPHSHADPVCKNLGRIYYMPYVSYPAGPDGDFEFDFDQFEDGAALDVEELLRVYSTLPAKEEASPEGKSGLFHIEQLDPLIKRLGRGESGTHAQLKAWVKKLTLGTALPFEKGERHVSFALLTKAVADFFPNVDPNVLYRVAFKASVTRMNQDGDPADPVTAKEIVDLLSGAQAKFHDKKAQDKAAQTEREIEECQSLGIEGPYNDEKIDDWCDKMGLTKDKLKRHLVLGVGDDYYTFFEGSYLRTVKSMADNGVRANLRPSTRVLGLSLVKTTKDGFTPLTAHEIMERYGENGYHLKYEADRKHTGLDFPNRHILMPLFKRQDMPAERSPFVEGWLRAMCPDEEQLETLEKWLAWSLDLTRSLSLLFLSGAPGTGKTLFAEQLSQVWGDAPADIESVFSQFNSQMFQSPIVLADEGFPADQTRKIRKFLSRYRHEVQKKYHDMILLQGFYRLIVTSNDEYTFYRLRTEVLNKHDISALAARTYHLKVEDAAETYLEEAGHDRIAEMIATKEFARHVLHLGERYKDAHRARFGTQAKESVINAVAVSGGVPSQLLRWMINYLLAPKEKQMRKSDVIRVDAQRIILNLRAFDDWTAFLPNEPKPSHDDIQQAFQTITWPRSILKATTNKSSDPGSMATFFAVNNRHLRAWLANNEAYVNSTQVENLMAADSPVNYSKNTP